MVYTGNIWPAVINESSVGLVTIPSGSTDSGPLVNGSLGASKGMTIYVPAMSGASVDVQVMATSGSTWTDLYDEGNTQVVVTAQAARNINSAGGYAYRFVSGASEGADRVIVVVATLNK